MDLLDLPLERTARQLGIGVRAAFTAIADNYDTLTAEMGQPASAAAAAEAMVTLQVSPYPRRVMAVASRPS